MLDTGATFYKRDQQHQPVPRDLNREFFLILAGQENATIMRNASFSRASSICTVVNFVPFYPEELEYRSKYELKYG